MFKEAIAQKKPIVYLATAGLLLGPIVLLGILSYRKADKNLENLIFSRRQAIAHLTASLLKEKLDGIMNLGTSLATRVRFRELISGGKWDEAFDIVRDIPRDFPFVETVSLISPDGISMATAEESAHLRGRNFSERDWYKGVSKEWRPYLSEAYRTATNLNSVIAAIPIMSGAGKVLGILLLQVLTKTLLEWSGGTSLGEQGFIYIVDHKGHLVAHPKFSPTSDIVDFSSVPIVQKVLKGDRGIEVQYNPIEREEGLSAYEPVSGYGWGVVVTEPVAAAFLYLEENLSWVIRTYGILFLINAFFVFFFFSLIASQSGPLKPQEGHE